MTDRELLELAAKAAGPDFKVEDGTGFMKYCDGWSLWNPLTDDGDALRLAVKCELHVFGSRIGGNVNNYFFVGCLDCGNDPYAATRRAIVQAAAAMVDSTGK